MLPNQLIMERCRISLSNKHSIMGSSTVEHISRVTETEMYKAVVLRAGAAELEILIYFMIYFIYC